MSNNRQYKQPFWSWLLSRDDPTSADAFERRQFLLFWLIAAVVYGVPVLLLGGIVYAIVRWVCF